ncbi:unnamed protein product, partial [Polarella glacialis]
FGGRSVRRPDDEDEDEENEVEAEGPSRMRPSSPSRGSSLGLSHSAFVGLVPPANDLSSDNGGPLSCAIEEDACQASPDDDVSGLQSPALDVDNVHMLEDAFNDAILLNAEDVGSPAHGWDPYSPALSPTLVEAAAVHSDPPSAADGDRSRGEGLASPGICA